MLWFLLALSGAFFDGLYYAIIKKIVKDIDQYVLAGGVFFVSFIALGLISLFKGIPEIGPKLYFSIIMTGSLNVIAAILYFKALKISDLSLTIPMLSFTPIFLIITSLLILKEFPSILGISGIFLIVLGSYVLNTEESKSDFLAPVRSIFINKGTSYMLAVAFIFSISSNFDKLVVLNSDPIFGSAIVHLFMGVSFLILSIGKKRDVREVYGKNLKVFILAGTALTLGAITFNLAISMEIVPYVISIKRLSILFAVIMGAAFFKEENFSNRAKGAAIMVLGAVIIVLF